VRVNQEVVEVFVEIPKGSRNKYEFDPERGHIRLDRRLFSATVYPGDYGFVPETLAEDGDPIDALVLVEDPTFPGCLINVRVLGVYLMEDEKGRDAKLIVVPDEEPLWEGTDSIDQLPDVVRAEIEHFFDVYKMLEPDKKTIAHGYEGKEVALRELQAARARVDSSPQRRD
jgi:inorganic pyrophosphatase